MKSPELQGSHAGLREWFGLAILALPCMMYAMDLTVLTLAIPALSAALKPSSTELLWIVDIYGFMVAGLLLTMGSVGEKFGAGSCCSSVRRLLARSPWLRRFLRAQPC